MSSGQLKRLSNMDMPDSCLSTNTREILCKTALSEPPLSHSQRKYITDDGFILWNFTMPDDQTEDRSYFIESAQLLAPMFAKIEEFYSGMALEDFQEKFCAYLQWTTSPQELLQSFQYLKSDDDGTGVLLSILMSSSILDRSLGDVFLTSGHQCPLLLKDLLATSELLQLLGPLKIQLLKVLIGPPISLNIRNVVWHGFPSPKELHQRYGYVLMCVIVSIGRHLTQQEILNKIKHRPQASLQPLHEMHQRLFPFSLNEEYLGNATILIDSSSLILPKMRPVWHRAIELFGCDRFGECAVLLLPQLELVMRKVFAAANGCPQRVLTAESNVLFTTFDEILSQVLPDGTQNKVRCVIGDQFMNLLLDLLTYPEGPRVRDRMSHGECRLNDVTEQMASTLLCVCLALCSLHLDQEHPPCATNELLTKITSVTANYDSIFHPLSRLKAEVFDNCTNLNRWKNFPQPRDYQSDGKVKELGDLHDLQELFDHFSSSFNLKEKLFFDDPFCDLCPLTQKVNDLVFPSLFRHAKDTKFRLEAEQTGLLRSIMAECSAVSVNVEKGLVGRYEQWTTRTLRSRQRTAYFRTIDCLPVISLGLRCSLLVVVWFLRQFSLTSSLSASFTRVLKRLLQVTENLRSNLSETKNRWLESVELILQLPHKLREIQQFKKVKFYFFQRFTDKISLML